MSTTAKKLTLHIGTGKAGSTSIQKSLDSLKESTMGVLPIQAFGLPNAKFLAMASRSVHTHSYFVRNHKVVTEDDFENNAKTIWETARREMESSGAHRFVASSEFLCNMVRGDDIETLKRGLEQLFDQTHIIVYLRDQRSFLRSLWAQTVKGPSKSGESFGEFLSHIDKRRHLWDYSIFLMDWLQVFGEENLKVTVFDPKALYGGDVVSDFLHKAGIDKAAIGQEKHSNVSPNWSKLEALRLKNLSRSNPAAAENATTAEQDIEQDQYEAFVLEKVSEGNHWINEAFLKDQPIKLPFSSQGCQH
jgi:hypothetical protein